MQAKCDIGVLSGIGSGAVHRHFLEAYWLAPLPVTSS